MHRTRFFRDLLCCLLLLAPGQLQAARWYEDYQNAINQVEAGECSPEAIESLGAAVVDKPKPQIGKRTYAQRRIDYLPYLTLARAHFLCGNIKLARQYLEKSRSYGVAPQTDLERLEAKITAALKVSAPTPTPTLDPQALRQRYDKAQRALSEARAANARLKNSLGAAAQILEKPPADWKSEEGSAASRISDLGSEIERAKKGGNLLALADATTRAASITLDLEKLQSRVDQRVEARRKELEEPEPTPTPQPLPTRAPAALQPQPIPTPVDSGPEVPDSLYKATLAFFAGDYPSVLRHLESINAPDSRMRAASFLLRAAARLNSARLAEEEESGKLRTLAAEDLAQVKALAPGLKPDPAYFSPSLIRLFDQSGG